ncbi:hypothetical protein AB8V91_11205 [Archangium violaceum]
MSKAEEDEEDPDDEEDSDEEDSDEEDSDEEADTGQEAQAPPAPAPLTEAQKKAARAVRFQRELEQLEQEREDKANREGAVAEKLKVATIQFTKSARKHLAGGDRAAGLASLEDVKRTIRNAETVEADGTGTDGAPTYRILYGQPSDRLSIKFSTPDEGQTLKVFHVGPGG